jgi:hypothetical protein
MIGIYNRDESWEKQTNWDLDNGCQIILSFSDHYGEFISSIHTKDKMIWHCSDGLSGLPDFAISWIEVVNENAEIKLVRPKFDRKWK